MVKYTKIDVLTGEISQGDSSCDFEKVKIAEKSRRELVRRFSPAAKFYLREILNDDLSLNVQKTSELDEYSVPEAPVI